MPSKEKPAILVVDDEESVRRVIGRILGSQGYCVREASGVDEALVLLQEQEYDVLLTDYMMGARTGLELIADSEDMHPDMVKILLTGFGGRELYRDVVNRGSVFSIIEKPSDTESLLDTIARAVEHRLTLLNEREETDKLRTQYHDIFANTTDLIQCIDVNGSFIYVNPAWYRTLGYSKSNIRSMTLHAIVRKDFVPLSRTLLERLETGKQIDPFEIVFISEDDREVYLEGSATSRVRDGELITSTCILRDVTERKRASEEIQSRLRQETMVARIAELLANIDEPIAVYGQILDVIGRTVYADQAYLFAFNEVDRELFHVESWCSESYRNDTKLPRHVSFSLIPSTIESIRNGDVIEIISGADLTEPDKSFFKTLDISSLLIIPVIVNTCSVGILGIDTVTRARTWESKDINMLKAASDIIANAWTRQIEIDVRRQKELEAEESRLLVIRADRLAALGTMAAGIIHEITQPLNAINVSAQTILYGVDRGWTLESEQVQKSLNLIVDQIKRMSEIITNMRAFARDGFPTPHRMDSLNTQIERVFTMIGEQMKAHDITVEFDYGDIPETAMNTHQILQVILNLVTNARQALDDTEKDDKRIVIKTYASDDCVFLDVSDNGPGIPGKLREKIFDPFFTTKEVGKGTGLGLSISAGILLEHKGELVYRDNDMGGASFVVRLPIEVVDT